MWPPAEPHLLVISAAFRIFSLVSLESTVSLVIGDLSLLDDGSMGWAPIMCSCSSVIPRVVRSLFRAFSWGPPVVLSRNSLGSPCTRSWCALFSFSAFLASGVPFSWKNLIHPCFGLLLLLFSGFPPALSVSFSFSLLRHLSSLFATHLATRPLGHALDLLLSST